MLQLDRGIEPILRLSSLLSILLLVGCSSQQEGISDTSTVGANNAEAQNCPYILGPTCTAKCHQKLPTNRRFSPERSEHAALEIRCNLEDSAENQA